MAEEFLNDARKWLKTNHDQNIGIGLSNQEETLKGMDT